MDPRVRCRWAVRLSAFLSINLLSQPTSATAQHNTTQQPLIAPNPKAPLSQMRSICLHSALFALLSVLLYCQTVAASDRQPSTEEPVPGASATPPEEEIAHTLRSFYLDTERNCGNPQDAADLQRV